MKYRISDLLKDKSRVTVNSDSFLIKSSIKLPACRKQRVNLLALGDVGGTLLMGLHLMGGDVIDSIGICDLNEAAAKRYEMEINQIEEPFDNGRMPKVEIIDAGRLFDCDVMIFCASKGVPPVGAEVKDVRMAQLEANKQLAAGFAEQAVRCGFKGLFAVVSDPVDPLCKAVLDAGLKPEQVQGFGLGVMNARALYYARKDERFTRFLTEGRAFGPHGQDLIIADSITDYNDEISRELTQLAVESNLRTRELGFKPYIAPALSSGAISILRTLRGEWNYSSVYFGEAFLGVKNRRAGDCIEVENIPLPHELFIRIENAYNNLKKL